MRLAQVHWVPGFEEYGKAAAYFLAAACAYCLVM